MDGVVQALGGMGAHALGRKPGPAWCVARLIERLCEDACVPLNHVALTVSDRERSAAFYGEHFGLTDRIHDDPQRLILSTGDGSLLALSEGDPVADLLPSTNHFGFQLPSREAVLAARERLRVAGVVEVEWQGDGSPLRVQVVDPDGYRVEFYAY